MLITSIQKSLSTREVCKCNAFAIAYSPIQKEIMASISDANQIVTINPATGNSRVFFESQRLNTPKSLVFSSNGESLYIENEQDFIGVRTRAAVAFSVVGKRGKAELNKLTHFKKESTYKRFNGMAYAHRAILMCVPECDVVISVKESSLVSKVAGSGVRGFGISSSPQGHPLNQPCGICFIPSVDRVFLSDTGSGIIRESTTEFRHVSIIGDIKTAAIVDGDKKTAKTLAPKEIVEWHGTVLAFVDGEHHVRTLDYAKNTISTVYESKSIIQGITASDDEIFVAEV